ncbi:MAG: carboxypeptidase-like regulatory domain-containing protein, partial [Verrucomicrobiota bacterium JB024]|nr:carboxypeptidase-like regulatory domain-containing protein [Verrucomicrobiota bacterium JB024]
AGIGVINGNNSGPDWTNSDQLRDVGPQLVTQDFAIPQADTAFITGVVFDDDDGDKTYAPGEGAGGVRIDVDGSVYYAISTASGGYSVPVYADGIYTVTFEAPGYPTVTRTVTITGMQNVKVDWRRLRLTVSSITNSPSDLTSIIFHAESESPTAAFSLLKSNTPGGPYSEVSGASPTGPLGDDEAYTYTYQRSPGEEVFFRVRVDD